MLFSRAFVFLIILVGGGLCAQSTQLHFKQFTTEDGLPSSETYVVFEDKSGYIWVGTDNGVARYDGYEFEVFDSNDGLDDVVVFTILQDSNGKIWAGTLSGKAYYFEQGKFHSYRHNDAIVAIREGNEFIHLIDVQEDGEVVFRLLNSGLFIVNQGGDVRSLTAEDPEDFFYYVPNCEGEGKRKLAPIKRNFPKAIRDSLYYGEELRGRFKIVLGNEFCQREITSLTLTAGKASRWPITYISVVPKRDKEQIYFFHGDSIRISSADGRQKTFGLGAKTMNYAMADLEDKLWIGHDGGIGLELVDFGSSSLKVEESHLAGRSVSYIARDRRGGMWVSTTDAGVFYCPSPNQRKHLINPGTKALAIAATGEFSFYVSYSDATFFQVDTDQEKVVEMDVKGAEIWNWSDFILYDELSQTVLTDLCLIEHLPINERGDGLGNSPYQEDAAKYVNGIKRMSFSSFKGNRKGLVANTLAFGILDLDKLTTDFVHRDENLSVSAFYIDANGRYLLGTLDGLMEFDSKHPDSIIRRVDFGVKELNTRIVAIEGYKGGLLFGMRGEGLVYLKDGVAQIVKEKDGMASNMVRDMDISDAGDIWVASLNGLSKVTLSDNGPIVRTFRSEHGLISNEIHDIDVYKNDVWVATSSGVQKFVEPPLITYSPKPGLRRFIVDGDTVNASVDMKFGAGDHNVSILFSTINFALGDEINYRYSLEEGGPWEYTDQRIVNFPKLGAGDYYFSVASQNEDQIWSEELKTNFTIAKYWYKTWPAILGGLLLFAASISFYFIWRERRNRWEQDLLLQINQLEHEAMHAQMNPHFVFNALNSIQNFVVHNDAKQAATYLSRFALVVRQTLNSSVKGQQTLAQEINMLETYLVLEKLRFKEAFQYKIVQAPDMPLEDIILPPLLIQPFVENAILHGLKETDGEGLIQISFSGNRQLLKVEIEDNGTGYEIDQEVDEESMGMTITRQRLAMMKGEKNEASKMEVESTFNNEGNLQGTKVTLWIYLEKFLANKDQLNPKEN